jgi:hypothetical protein
MGAWRGGKRVIALPWPGPTHARARFGRSACEPAGRCGYPIPRARRRAAQCGHEPGWGKVEEEGGGERLTSGSHLSEREREKEWADVSWAVVI